MSIRKYKLEDELNINQVLKLKKIENRKVDIQKVPPKFIKLNNAIKSLQLSVCTENPEEISFFPRKFVKMFKSFYGNIIDSEIHSSNKSTMVFYNNLYLYPNMDNFFFYPGEKPSYLQILNNPLNPSFNDILTNPFSVRFDLRNEHNNLIVLQIYNMLVLDYDVKDFFKDVNETNIAKTKKIILESFKKLCTKASENGLDLVWCLAETDKGFHLFLVNHYVDIKNPFWSMLLVQLCCDINYAVFSRAQSFCVRLSAKAGRPNDKVAQPYHTFINLGETNLKKYDFIFAEKSQLASVKPDLLKIIKFKYRLIKYFSHFTYKYIEYVYWFNDILFHRPKFMEFLNKIRDHIRIIWNDHQEETIDFRTFESIFKYDTSKDYTHLFKEIKKIFNKNYREKHSPGTLIQEIPPGGLPKKKPITKTVNPDLPKPSAPPPPQHYNVQPSAPPLADPELLETFLASRSKSSGSKGKSTVVVGAKKKSKRKKKNQRRKKSTKNRKNRKKRKSNKKK